MISAAGKVSTVFMPGIEFSKKLGDRTALAFEIGWPITNDWFYDYNVDEHYSSFTFSLGTIFVF